MLRKLIRRLVAIRAKATNPPPLWMVVDNSGFDLHEGQVLKGRVEWGDVLRIAAFKRDRVTSDLVCLEFELAGDKGFFEVNEQVAGFWDLLRHIKSRFPESDQRWEEDVVKPAFRKNWTVIFERRG